jgi:hypothetical protein
MHDVFACGALAARQLDDIASHVEQQAFEHLLAADEGFELVRRRVLRVGRIRAPVSGRLVAAQETKAL